MRLGPIRNRIAGDAVLGEFHAVALVTTPSFSKGAGVRVFTGILLFWVALKEAKQNYAHFGASALLRQTHLATSG